MDAAPPPADVVSWERLDRRAVARTAIGTFGLPIGLVVPVLAWASRNDVGAALTLALAAAAWLLALAAICVYEALRNATTWYRVTDERVELRTELILHRRRSLPRDRIRTVDLSAGPSHRLLGLSKVEIGTAQDGGSGGDRLTLDPVGRAQAEALRRALLRREPLGAGAGEHDAPAPAAPPLAALDLGWIRYAPLSLATPTLGVAAAGALFQAAEWVGLQDDVVRRADDALHIWQAVVAVALLVLLVGAFGTLAAFVEQWFGYRLARDADGTLTLRRGLLTTRSLALEERRLRGVELVEPLAVRCAGAARVEAVASGLGKGDDRARTQHATLLPAAPLAIAEHVAGEVLHGSQLGTELRPHPPAARRRRRVRGLATLGALVALLVVLGATVAPALLPIAAAVAVLGTPVALWFAHDAYRSLGHALTGDHLVVRSGSFRRRTVVLDRGGVIGWNVSRSPLQRRAGLATLTATTAAGRGAYHVLDVDAEEGLAFADAAVPGLLSQFAERLE